MKKLIALVALLLVSIPCYAVDCSLVYDEFDSLMNKDFLVSPSRYVKTVSNRLSRNEYNSEQKGKFLLSSDHKGLGVAIVHTNNDSWGKLLFTWGRPIQNGHPSLVIKEAVIYGRVNDGFRPRTLRDLNLKSSFKLDIDTGRSGGNDADIWFHNIDGNTMYIEAVNGATLEFPVQSLCRTQSAQTKSDRLTVAQYRKQILKPVGPVKLDGAQPIGSASSGAGNNTSSSGAGSSEKTVVRREILPNGHVLISYSDGSAVERFEGGMTLIAPDGSRQQLLFSTAAPAAIPVAPPDAMEADWLEGHREGLLNIIKSVVSDASLVQQVLDSVDTSGNPYESIETRSEIIQRLVLP